MSPEQADGVTALLGKSSELQGLSTMGGLELPQLRAKPSGDGREGVWCLEWGHVTLYVGPSEHQQQTLAPVSFPLCI